LETDLENHKASNVANSIVCCLSEESYVEQRHLAVAIYDNASAALKIIRNILEDEEDNGCAMHLLNLAVGHPWTKICPIDNEKNYFELGTSIMRNLLLLLVISLMLND
jgi:hypothetical protein